MLYVIEHDEGVIVCVKDMVAQNVEFLEDAGLEYSIKEAIEFTVEGEAQTSMR